MHKFLDRVSSVYCGLLFVVIPLIFIGITTLMIFDAPKWVYIGTLICIYYFLSAVLLGGIGLFIEFVKELNKEYEEEYEEGFIDDDL